MSLSKIAGRYVKSLIDLSIEKMYSRKFTRMWD